MAIRCEAVASYHSPFQMQNSAISSPEFKTQSYQPQSSYTPAATTTAIQVHTH